MSAEEVSPRRRRRRFLIGFDESELPVKPEPEEDIKDYAETTMNELLGWYGYEKVDSRDTQGLNLTHFASNSEEIKNPSVIGTPPSSGVDGSDASEDGGSQHEHTDGPPARTTSDSVSPGPDISPTMSDEVAKQQHIVSALSLVTKHPGAPDSPNLPPGCIVCAWCQKVGMKLFTLKTPNGYKAFCSELCFNQCRRAAFKKSKICDWCKHVRHTVNYVDFQDGEQQLQFCSDKCLNQYKMNLFCKETQAHLQMHTHLKEAACKMKASGSVNLITPELWLRDCKINGLPLSPTALDSTDDVNSDENITTAPSPSAVMESSTPSSPVLKEKKEASRDIPVLAKEKDRSSRKSSKGSPKKGSDVRPSHSHKHHREKKVNGMQHDPPLSRHSPIHASPSSHSSRNSHGTSGTPSLLSPPPLGLPRLPSLHVGSMPPRHGPPPVPNSLGIGNIDPGRQPFMHPGMMPPPFQFIAQHQMENMIRSQRGLDLRSKAPPPPHMPIPPWIVPPFPPLHPPPPQPGIQPPPIQPPPNSSLTQSSPLPLRTHHHSHHSASHKSSSHHGKHRHSRKSTGHSDNGSAPTPASTLMHNSTLQLHPPLVPPVTIMVPFPLPIPIPLPIPVPIPIPSDIVEKYKVREEETGGKRTEKNNSLSNDRKRKLSCDSLKSKKSYVHPVAETSVLNPEMNNKVVKPSVSYYDQLENLSFRVTESQTGNSKAPKPTNHDLDVESRSYSPLSETFSSNDDEEDVRKIKNGELESFSTIQFSAYGLSLARSSPVTSLVNDLLPTSNTLDLHKSPSPTNLSVKDKQNSTHSAINFKKKHLREQLPLRT